MKIYPADKVEIGSEVDDALRARADSEAAGGNAAEAAESYRQLLDRIMAAKPSVENNLTATSELCSLYGSLASLYRVSGHPDLASSIETRRLALWTNWDRNLPKNPFILRRLAAARVQ